MGNGNMKLSRRRTNVGRRFFPKKGEFSFDRFQRMKNLRPQGRKSQADPQYSSIPLTGYTSYNKGHKLSERNKSIDKGRRYKRRKETKVKVNTGSIELNTVIEQDISTCENKGSRVIKAPIAEWKETPKNQNLKLMPDCQRAMLGSELQGEDFAKRMGILNKDMEDNSAEETELYEEVKGRVLTTFFKQSLTEKLKEEKDDEVKDDESTKKSGKRRKQMAKKVLETYYPVPVAKKTPSVLLYKKLNKDKKEVYQIV
ncbi:hypothetical protein Tco_0064917 [Tanacetum coccineum]